jgi:hypothetical protein
MFGYADLGSKPGSLVIIFPTGLPPLSSLWLTLPSQPNAASSNNDFALHECWRGPDKVKANFPGWALKLYCIPEHLVEDRYSPILLLPGTWLREKEMLIQRRKLLWLKSYFSLKQVSHI